MYLWKAVKTRQFFIWIIFPVFPVIEVHTEPVKLHKEHWERLPQEFLFKWNLWDFYAFIWKEDSSDFW